jgi:hypothetical protein
MYTLDSYAPIFLRLEGYFFKSSSQTSSAITKEIPLNNSNSYNFKNI